MILKLSVTALRNLGRGGYAPEILQEPLVDKHSLSPRRRAELIGSTAKTTFFDDGGRMWCSSLYKNAQPAYLDFYRPTINILDSPCEVSLISRFDVRGVRIIEDHVAWAHALDCSRSLEFYHCNLADFLAATAAWPGTHRFVNEQTAMVDTCILYGRDLIDEAKTLWIKGALKKFKYNGRFPADWDWLTLD